MCKKQIGVFLLAGGVGKRLWPLSNALHPKYLLKTSGGEITLVEETLQRLEKTVDFFDVEANFAICTSIRGRKILEKVFKKQKNTADLKIYAESLAKNTMSAIAALTAIYVRQFPEITIITTPTDQIVLDQDAFARDLRAAKLLADAGNVVVLGTKMKSAQPGFGYIHASGSDENAVAEFTEKPDIHTAQEYLARGEHFINSGIYVFKGAVLLAELEKLQPELHRAVMHAASNVRAETRQIDHDAKQASISIDDALSVPLAKLGRLKMVRAQFEFQDIGTFNSLLNYYNSSNASIFRKLIAYLAIACTWLLRR